MLKGQKQEQFILDFGREDDVSVKKETTTHCVGHGAEHAKSWREIECDFDHSLTFV